MKRRVQDTISLMVGAFLFALAINMFIIPNELGEGGVAGITIISHYLFQWSPWIVMLTLNSLLLIVGYRFLDKTTTIYTIITVIFNSIFLRVTYGWSIASDDLIINAIFGGLIAGAGVGMVIRAGGTTAGSAVLAKIANKYLGWSISYALLLFDVIVVLASYFIIGAEKVMYTIIMLYIATKIMEFIIEGLNPQKAITIISKNQDAIAEQVNHLMHRGVTVLSGHGYYTKEPKQILYIVINKQEIPSLKKIVKNSDKDAFLTIHDIRDVFGEGFLDISKS